MERIIKSRAGFILLILALVIGFFVFKLYDMQIAQYESDTNKDGLLNIGDQGKKVTQLQKDLNTLGYKIEVDGIFGNQTENSIIDFQTDMGIGEDGMVGPSTEGALKSAVKANTYSPDDFVEEVQKITGTIINGIAGPETLSKSVPAC